MRILRLPSSGIAGRRSPAGPAGAGLAAFAALLLLSSVQAAPHPLDREIKDCIDDAPGTAATIECVNRGREKWRAELDRLDEELTGLLPRKGQRLFRQAQRSWSIWMISEFNLLDAVYYTIYNNLDGGTMWLVINAAADLEVVRGRALEVLGYLEEMKTGDPSPPGRTGEPLVPDGDLKEESLRLGEALGAEKRKASDRALAAWRDFRNKEIAFLAWLYGREGDRNFRRERRMVKNAERIERLRALFADLRHGGLE